MKHTLDAPIARRRQGRAPTRRLASTTLIAVLALGACGDDDTDGPGPDEPQPGTEQTTTTSPGGGEMPPTTEPRGTTESLPDRPQEDGTA